MDVQNGQDLRLQEGRYLHNYICIYVALLAQGSCLEFLTHHLPNTTGDRCLPQILGGSGLLSAYPFIKHFADLLQVYRLRLVGVICGFLCALIYVCIPMRLECVLLLRLACVIAGFPVTLCSYNISARCVAHWGP